MKNFNTRLIYWEKQRNDRMCALHCLNSLLQGPYFCEHDLAVIASDLDLKERQLMAAAGTNTEEYKAFIAQDSLNASDDGFFNITVLEACLKTMNISCINSNKPEMISVLENPCSQEGYILNLSEHWFSIRKIGNIWYNLDSLKCAPSIVSEFYLSILLNELKRQGYSLYVVVPFEGKSMPMPHPTDGLNSNQMYLTDDKIEELHVRGRQKEEANANAAQAFAEKEYSSYSLRLPPAKDLGDKSWPKEGGYVMRDEKTIAAQDFAVSESEDELNQAILLSMQAHKKPSPPVELPSESISNLEKVCIQVRVTNGAKLIRTFLKSHKMINVFEWVEYELINSNLIIPSIIEKPYFLIVPFKKLKFFKTENSKVDLIDEFQNRKDVSNQTLEDLGFSCRESFIFHY